MAACLHRWERSFHSVNALKIISSSNFIWAEPKSVYSTSKCETCFHATNHKQITLNSNNLGVDGLRPKETFQNISQFNLKGIAQGLNCVAHNPWHYDLNL